MKVAEILSRFEQVRRVGNGWTARCPAHEDRKPSLSIREEGGKILLHCHAGCPTERVLEAVGLKMADLSDGSLRPQIVATYDYCDEQENLLYQAVRYEPKNFKQRRPDGKGGWTWNLKGMRRVLYRLPDVLKAKSVLVLEGEKDCETARKLGLTATCNPGGAGKWCDEYSEPLRGKHVTVIVDADEPGRKHAHQVAESLHGKAESLKLIELPDAKDLTEWVEKGGTPKALLGLIQNAPESKSETMNAARNKILLEPGETPRAVDCAEKLLAGHAEVLGIFQRAGELVRVVTLDVSLHSKNFRRPAGSIMLVPLSAVALTEILDNLATWQRSNKDGDSRRVDCPAKVAQTYLSRVGRWCLSELRGVITAPILRPDGTVLIDSGYDNETGLFLMGSPRVTVLEHPTRDDALVALGALREPFSEFPFANAESESVFLAAILTALQRRLLESALLFGFDAPTPRTGKSLLAEGVGIIATGQPAPAMAVSGEGEELRKAVGALLREGHSIVNLDNLERPLRSPDLSRALTQSEYADRVLGESKLLRLPTNITWTATGNNLCLRGDLAVRGLLCRLDAQLENPELRSFRIPDLPAYLAEHRAELLGAALTILRAYHLAGQPEQKGERWGGFVQWSREIRDPLLWLGLANPCVTRQRIIADDPDRESAAALLSAWYGVFVDKKVIVVEGKAHNSPELAQAVLAVAARKNSPGQPDTHRLGYWCRSWADRPVAGFRLQRLTDPSDRKAARAAWLVSRCDGGISGLSSGQNKTDSGREKWDGWDKWDTSGHQKIDFPREPGDEP